jgi:hypothetical protein
MVIGVTMNVVGLALTFTNRGVSEQWLDLNLTDGTI